MKETDHKLIEKDAFMVVGRRRVTPYSGGTWNIVKEDGSIQLMEKLKNDKPLLGLCFGFNADGSNDYMVGIEYDKNIDNFESYSYPKYSWLIYEVSGKISENVLINAWAYVNNDLLLKLGYKKSEHPTIETHHKTRLFCCIGRSVDEPQYTGKRKIQVLSFCQYRLSSYRCNQHIYNMGQLNPYAIIHRTILYNRNT